MKISETKLRQAVREGLQLQEGRNWDLDTKVDSLVACIKNTAYAPGDIPPDFPSID